MKTMNANSKIVKGNLFGGDIEPGVFHARNVSNSCWPNLVEETEREESESITNTDVSSMSENGMLI